MKKIILLLLSTIASYGQAVFDEGIQITGNANSATATKVNVQEANGKVNTQTIKTGFNKNFGLNSGDVVGANTLLNQYSTTPIEWTATAFNSGQVVFFAGKQWISKIATVAGDVPATSSKWEEITFDALANKTTTVDQTIIDGSTNAVSSNAVFDGLALKSNIGHTHVASQITDLSKASVGLGNVDNTSDLSKPLSTATINALATKFPTPTGLTANNLPKWNGSGFGDSQIVDNGTTVKIGSARPSFSEGISISKNITTTNRHSFEDYSIINSSIPNFGFGVFDASTEMAGNLSNDHFNAFQSRLIYSSSANLLDTDISRSMCSFLSRNIITGSGGMKYSIGIKLDNLRVTGTGIVENLYGLYVEPQTKGTVSNFDIYSQGRSNNFGTISINTLNKDTSLNVNGQDNTYIISSFKGGYVLSGKKYSGITIGKEFATDGETGLLGYYTNQSNNLLSGIYLANYGDSEINKSIFLQRGGKVFIGANSDNASGALMQVNGTISASPATTANQVPTWGQVQAMAGTSGSYTNSGLNLSGFSLAVYTVRYIKVGNIISMTVNGTVNTISTGGTFHFLLPSGLPRPSATTELIGNVVLQRTGDNSLVNGYVRYDNATPLTQMFIGVTSGLSIGQNYNYAVTFNYSLY